MEKGKKLLDLAKPLLISDVDFRIQSVNNGGYATILAYKDARVDMKRLDEVMGAGFWQRDVKVIDGTLYCGVGIYVEKLNDWVWKWDAGSETFSDKEKGRSSDAFKRACFNLGIGRELYDYPIIQLKLKDNEIDKSGSKPKTTWAFNLKQWKWLSQFDEDGKITFLAAQDTTETTRFKWGEYDKNKVQIEYSVGGLSESNPHEHEKETRGTTDSEEEGNVDGITKKTNVPIEKEAEPSEEDIKRKILTDKYVVLFDKEPRSNMKLETIESKINEEEDRIESLKSEPEVESPTENKEGVELKPEVEMESEVVDAYAAEPDPKPEVVGLFDGPMGEDAKKIATFNDKNDLKSWAVPTFKKWEGNATKEHINEFKDLCNKQFEKIG